MATISGGVAEFTFGGANSTLAALGHLPGRTQGMAASRSAFNRRFYGIQSMADRTGADTFTDVTPTSGPGLTPTLVTGNPFEFVGNTGLHWFERVHIFPGGAAANPDYDENYKIEFGNILADVEAVYEIYNASRRNSVTVVSIDETAVDPGIELDEIIPTNVIGPQQSRLSTTSTFNTDGVTGLGTLVPLTVRALEDGLPKFDGSIIFEFAVNNVALPVRGSRIALNLAEYEAPVIESMSFATDIITSTNGKEQRISLRAEPREGIKVNYRLDGTDRQRFQAVLMDWQENNFGVPLWHESVQLTTASAALSSQWQVSGAADVDFRVGGLAILFIDAFNFEVSTIVSVTDTLIEVSNQNSQSYPAGTRVAPVRVARIAKIPEGLRYHQQIEDFQVVYEWIDNVTGAPASSSTAWNSNTYDSKILLDDCNVMQGTLPESFDRDITMIDGITGIVTQTSGWDRNKHSWQKGFVAHNRTEIKNLKALLRHLRGRQKSFWMPTKIEDLTASAALISSSQILDIVNIDYARYVRNRGPKNVIRVTYNNGNSPEIKEITSSAAHPTDSEQERLTVDSGWANGQALDTIERIEFLELVRMDADTFNMQHDPVGRMTLTAPVRVVFDE